MSKSTLRQRFLAPAIALTIGAAVAVPFALSAHHARGARPVPEAAAIQVSVATVDARDTVARLDNRANVRGHDGRPKTFNLLAQNRSDLLSAYCHRGTSSLSTSRWTSCGTAPLARTLKFAPETR